jgi:hypothetical protein
MMDIRSAMEAAATQLESAPEPASTPEPAEVEIPVEVEAAPEAKAEPEKSPIDRARDEEGKFAKAEKAKAKVQAKSITPKETTGVAPEAKVADDAGQEEPSPPPDPAPVVPTVKAPASWKPQAREAFSKAPPEVQQEVLRRESEISRTMQETAEARKTVESVRQTLAPYESLARSQGMDTMKYAGSVLQTAAALHMGSAQQRSQVIATLIASYGIDVDMVNAAMQGQPMAQGQQQAPPVDVEGLVERALQSRMQQANQARAAQAWDTFSATAPEFLETVSEDMKEILLIAGRQGKNITYEQAYDRACKLNEDVASVLAQRKAAQAARAPGTVTAATRAAASSVRSSPAAPPNGAHPKGVRGAMEAAAEKIGFGG